MNYFELFNSMHPDFFKGENIKDLPKDETFSELTLDLKSFEADPEKIACPEGITFGFIKDRKALLLAVEEVEHDWVQYFSEDSTVFGAFDGDKPISFCLIEDMGYHQGKRVGGPGCVGTLPKYRGRKVGLKMVLLATLLLKDQGFDISYIHYTHIDHWYQKLGYENAVRWNSDGIVWTKE